MLRTPRLTDPQARCLRILADIDDDYHGRPGKIAPREVARRMWPDSPGWNRRTRKYGTNDPGAVGGTMPMKAATLLWRLAAMGYAWKPGYDSDPSANMWQITDAGRTALDEHEERSRT